jgi:hypothetical protein
MAGGVLVCCRGRTPTSYTGQRAVEATSRHGSPEHTFPTETWISRGLDEFFSMVKQDSNNEDRKLRLPIAWVIITISTRRYICSPPPCEYSTASMRVDGLARVVAVHAVQQDVDRRMKLTPNMEWTLSLCLPITKPNNLL